MTAKGHRCLCYSAPGDIFVTFSFCCRWGCKGNAGADTVDICVCCVSIWPLWTASPLQTASGGRGRWTVEVSDGPSPGVVHVPAAVPLLFRLSGGQQSAGKSRQISTGRYGDPAKDHTSPPGGRHTLHSRSFHQSSHAACSQLVSFFWTVRC